MTFDAAWETEHARRAWGAYPCEHLVRFVSRNAWPRNDLQFLDLGCGAGAQSIFLAKHGRVVAVDGSQSAIDRINCKASCIVTQCLDLCDLRFPDHKFDCIVDVASLQCLPFNDAKAIIQRARRWLKPDGWFFSFTDGGTDSRLHTVGIVQSRSLGEVISMFEGYDHKIGSEIVTRPDYLATRSWIVEAKVR